jgi:hypothetical protein
VSSDELQRHRVQGRDRGRHALRFAHGPGCGPLATALFAGHQEA